ncbi:MAG: HAD family hydrolase [Bacilli bacterium]|nr:HAD family hydrolase [Bacilli bacterium]
MEKKDAINIFDFDGTLTTETWPKFWVWVKKFGFSGEARNDELEAELTKYRQLVSGSELETFFSFFNDLLVSHNETITLGELMEGEKYIVYNPGVLEFFAKDESKNYIISGGLKEFLEHLEIAKYFECMYGTSVKYDEFGNIIGIGKSLSDEDKVDAIKEILAINGRDENECNNVYFIGDGYSDYASLKYVHSNGGKAIFVHQETGDDTFYEYNQRIYQKLNQEGLIDYCCLADYRESKQLYKILKRQDDEGEVNL